MSGYGLLAYCNKGVPPTYPTYLPDHRGWNVQHYANMQQGDIAWVATYNLRLFEKHVLPHLKKKCILLVSQTDYLFPSESGIKNWQKFINHPCIYHIFAQNCDRVHPKITPIPIGIDFHSAAYKYKKGCWGETGSVLEQEETLQDIQQSLPPIPLRRPYAFVDFQHADTLKNGSRRRYLAFNNEGRLDIFRKLQKLQVIDWGPLMPRSQLWQTKGQYAFSISPPGNGMDCHRTWEDLALGCVVIVISTKIDPLYEGLPVIKVNSWLEVTQKNMQKWKREFSFAKPEYSKKLYQSYWVNLLLEKKQKLLSLCKGQTH